MTGSTPLSDTVAIVTGASRGIGREIALGFADAAAAVGLAARGEGITGRGTRSRRTTTGASEPSPSRPT